jgi:serine/threonine protein kinase
MWIFLLILLFIVIIASNYSGKREINEFIKNLMKSCRNCKVAGRGFTGTVYIIGDYAMKLENISKSEMGDSLKFSVNRETIFNEDLSKKLPDNLKQNFLHQIAFDKIAVDKLPGKFKNFHHKLHKNVPPNMQKMMNKRNLQPYVACRIYNKIDDILYNVIDTLTQVEIRRFIKQFINIVEFLQSIGYVHGDLHDQNIGVNRVGGKLYFVAIDYGLILHEKFTLNDNEKKQIKFSDMGFLPQCLCGSERRGKFWSKLLELIKQNKLPALSWKQDLKKLAELNCFAEFKNKIPECFQLDYCEMFYPDEFQRMRLGKYYKKTYKYTAHVPKEELEFIMNNYENISAMKKRYCHN